MSDQTGISRPSPQAKSPPPPSRRVAVGVSGGGRSLLNLLECQRRGADFCVAAVIASSASCNAVTVAASHGLPLFVGDFATAKTAATGVELYRWLEAHQVGWVALAGFLKRFPLVPSWRGRVVNIHPALLPRHGGQGMYGDRVHAAVLAAGERVSGATVHFVNEHYDDGARIAQIEVAVSPGDSVSSLAQRVFAAECQLYPQVLTQLLSGRLPLAAGAVELVEKGALP